MHQLFKVDWLKGEGISQRTYMCEPWAWTMVWGLIMGMGTRLGGRGQREENWDNSNNINNKNFKRQKSGLQKTQKHISKIFFQLELTFNINLY